MDTIAQQLEFTLQKISQAPGNSSFSRERQPLHPDKANIRNKEPREDKVATYKVHKPNISFQLSMGKMYTSGCSNVHSILKLKKW